MKRLRKWLKSVIRSKCEHELEVTEGIETGKLKEPSESSEREVQIRMIYVKCRKCSQTLAVSSRGIVYDPKYDTNGGTS